MPDPQDGSVSLNDFGPNEWLVDEMYQRFKEDPSSVDASWHEFLTDYSPDSSGDGAATQPAAPAKEPAQAPAAAAQAGRTIAPMLVEEMPAIVPAPAHRP